jgi:hypothetical protein
MSLARRALSVVVATSLVLSSLPLHAQTSSSDSSGLIRTEQVAAVSQPAAPAAATQGDRARLLATLDRADLAARLAERGVSRDDLKARVGALTDAEASELMAKIDSAPAGADILGLIFTVFIILLVTDILGLTKVFPFTRSVR